MPGSPQLEKGTSQASGRASASADKYPVFLLPFGGAEMPSPMSYGIKAGSWALATSIPTGTTPALSPRISLRASLSPDEKRFLLAKQNRVLCGAHPLNVMESWNSRGPDHSR